MRIFCSYAYSRQNGGGKRNQYKRLTRGKSGAHDKMVNVLTIREKGSSFTQTAIHNRHHIHQRDSDNP